jgi:hypothetical protein
LGQGELGVIDPAKACLYIPHGLSPFKQKLFDRLAARVGQVSRGNVAKMESLPPDILPIVGCSPELTTLIVQWRAAGRPFCYWDRGYLRRVFAASLPPAASLQVSYYRWHINAYQMASITETPNDRWKALGYDQEVRPWARGGKHIVIAAPSRTYARFHDCESWIADTIDALARVTSRQLVIRDKEHVRTRPLQKDLQGAHALVTHGSIAAVESVVLGCPVFVHPDSAAALVGQTNLKQIETPIYPDRQPFLNSLAYNQWTETEMFNGVLWAMLR